MYVRDARNRDEVWLLDHIEDMDLDEAAFRSREFVIAVDEQADERVGFGRLRVHTPTADVAELTTVGVLPDWRNQGVGAHVIERLVEEAGDDGYETVYALLQEPGYLTQFGFDPIDADDLPPVLADRLASKRADTDADIVPLELDVGDFEMPEHLRDAFKTATAEEDPTEDVQETAEDFGIDPDEATYKYDIGG
jgi:N-acetylglutamate synthase-like GNAT family acetyltransferase